MTDTPVYWCLGFLFVILVVFFAVSMRTNSRTRRYCQQSRRCFDICRQRKHDSNFSECVSNCDFYGLGKKLMGE